MQVNKQALITAIDTALGNYNAAKDAWDRAKAQWEKDRRAKFLAETQPEWKALRDRLTKAIRNDEPVTSAMVQHIVGDEYNRVRRDAYFVTDSNPPRKINGVEAPSGVPVQGLMSLKAALNAITDETLSHTQLSQLGYKNVEWIFRAAVANSPELN